MKSIFRRVFSAVLIGFYLLTPALSAHAAKTCHCPPPGHNSPACVQPGQAYCPTLPGYKETQRCCPQPTCGCECQDSCSCPNCDCAKIEHLCTHKNTPVDLVKICGCQAIIEQHSVIEANFGQRVFSKKLCRGDKISFVLPNGLYTREGRKLLPNCTQLIARVECIIPPKAFNKGAKISLKFCCVLLPNGRTLPIQARIFNAEGMLKETKLMAAGKVALWSIGLMGIGAGMGAAIGSASGNAGKACLTLGMPIGFGVGMLTGLVSPGLHYRAKRGEKILIQLTDNLCINL